MNSLEKRKLFDECEKILLNSRGPKLGFVSEITLYVVSFLEKLTFEIHYAKYSLLAISIYRYISSSQI